MAANGRIPTSQLAALPARWSNKGEVEYLRSDAYASLSRALSRAVADSGENFQIWDAYRSMAEQVAMLKRNYYAVSGGRRSGDRSYGGVTYRRRSGRPATASPGYSNHGNGLAIDIHHGGIQSWFQTQGRTYGWTWNEGERLGEAWHMVYDPALDQMTHEGVLDHAAVQKAVGADVDGKIGVGTVAKIREFQKAKGLTADGKVGAATKAAMGLGEAGSAPTRPQPANDPTPVTTTDGKAGTWYARSTWTSDPKAAVVLADNPDRVQTEIYIHWPGTPGVIGVESLDATKARILGYHKDHVAGEYTDLAYNTIVTQAGDIFEGRGIDRQSGANGGTVSNRRGQSILVLVGNDEIPTADCVAGIQKAIAMTRDVHEKATEILGHLESPDASTECCGPHLMALVDNGMLEPGAAISAPATAPTPATSSSYAGAGWTRAISRDLQGRLGVTADGRMGPKSWKALGRWLGAPYIDGKVSRQSRTHTEMGDGISPNGWEHTGRNSAGSQLITLLQAYVGAATDGIAGPELVTRLEAQLNASPASFTADHASTVRLRTKGVLDTISRPVKGAGKLTVDGRWGVESSKAWQRFLNSRTNAGLKVDGRLGPASHKAGQRYVGAPYKDGEVSRQSYRHTELGNGITANGWGYTGRGSSGSQYVKLLQKWCGVTQDGIWYEGLSKALQRKLNDHAVGM